MSMLQSMLGGGGSSTLTKRDVDAIKQSTGMLAYFGAIADDYNSDAAGYQLLDLTGWAPQSNGSNTPVFDNVTTGFTPRNGSIGLRLGNTTAGVSTPHGKTKTFPSMDLTNTDIVSIWVYCSGDMVTTGNNASTWGTVLVALGDSAAANISACNALGAAGGGWHRGWNNITLRKADFVTVLAGAGVNWASVGYIQIRFTPAAPNAGVVFWIDSIFFGGQIPRKKLPIVITLDDSTEEGVEMARIMNAHGIPVSYFIMRNEVQNHGTFTGYATPSQVISLYNAGNDIGIHASAVNGFVVDPAEMKLCSDYIASLGCTRNGCHLYGSYPNGGANQATIDLARSYGLRGLRGVKSTPRNDAVGVESATAFVGYESIMNGGIADPFRINGDAPTTSAAAITAISDAAVKKAAYISYHHTYADITNKANWVAYATHIKSLVDAGTHEALTFSQFNELYAY